MSPFFRVVLTADVAETFFGGYSTFLNRRLTADSRLDLINRRLKAQSARLKSRAVDLLPKGLRTPAGGGILLVEDDEEDEDGNELRRRKPGDKYRKEVEKEVERLKVKVGLLGRLRVEMLTNSLRLK
jgi:hypothetical protein